MSGWVMIGMLSASAVLLSMGHADRAIDVAFGAGLFWAGGWVERRHAARD